MRAETDRLYTQITSVYDDLDYILLLYLCISYIVLSEDHILTMVMSCHVIVIVMSCHVVSSSL